MHKWLALFLAYLLGSFFGISQVLGFFKGATTARAATASA